MGAGCSAQALWRAPGWEENAARALQPVGSTRAEVDTSALVSLHVPAQKAVDLVAAYCGVRDVTAASAGSSSSSACAPAASASSLAAPVADPAAETSAALRAMQPGMFWLNRSGACACAASLGLLRRVESALATACALLVFRRLVAAQENQWVSSGRTS